MRLAPLMRGTLLALVALGLCLPRAGAQTPALWVGPSGANNGSSLRALFEHPDQWAQARARTDVLMYSDLHFGSQFTDAELRAWLPHLNQWHIKLALEVGAIKPWGDTAQKTFHIEQPIWDRIQRLGGSISAVAMDEPLSCVRGALKRPDAYAVRQTADYVALVRAHYPTIQVGDIEPYPSIPLADHLAWIDALQNALAARHVRGLDFYRLDVDWDNIIALSHGSWKEVQQVEGACRSRGLPFGLIYWAADYPFMQHHGLADDSTWYVSLMQQGYDYALVGGAPNQYVIEDWVGAPARCVPDTADFTFTRSVRDFAQKFVKRTP